MDRRRPGIARRSIRAAAAPVAAVLAVLFASWSLSGLAEPADSSFCVACVSIRIGAPRIIRGPTAIEADNYFTAVQLNESVFRGFTANGTTYAIDGPSPAAMQGRAVPVLTPGPPASFDGCGQWLNSVERQGPLLFGFVHDETGCDYKAGQTHKSMSIDVSADRGLTWTDRGPFITGSDGPTRGKTTGEGDCKVVHNPDGFLYAYCLRARDWAIIAARAPANDPTPDRWLKYFEGAWTKPGRGGDATPLVTQDTGQALGTSASSWTATGATILLGNDARGLVAFISRDPVAFAGVTAPLLPTGPQQWVRPAPSELVAYPVLVDRATGGSAIGSAATLLYTYLEPDEDFSRRYLVARDITLVLQPEPAMPQVGVLLGRWRDAGSGARVSSTGPVAPVGRTLVPDGDAGYLMTEPDPGRPSVELDECDAGRGTFDRALQPGGCTAPLSRRLRTAGWVYATEQPGTRALYRCGVSGQGHFVSTEQTCEGQGTSEALLGYALAD